METRCGGLFFTSKFDSGNLAKVEKVGKDSDDDDGKFEIIHNIILFVFGVKNPLGQ